MQSGYASLAHAKVLLLTVTDAPHDVLCRSAMQLAKETQAAAIEVERVARFHPFRVARDLVVSGLSTISILSLLVFGRTFADAYLSLQQKIATIPLPLPTLRDELVGIVPVVPGIEHVARLPTLTIKDALIGTVAVIALILLFRVAQGIRAYSRNRLIAQSITDAARIIPTLESAALAPTRPEAVQILSEAMRAMLAADPAARIKNGRH